jgi:hypothetical protein
LTRLAAWPASLSAAWLVPALLALVLCGSAQAQTPQALYPDGASIAVFDFELFDTSLEGEMRGVDPLETQRLTMITTMIRDAYAARDVTVVDIAPLRPRLATMPKLRTCKGCEAKLAEPLGADLTVSGFVQKISTLILSVSLYVRDVETGALVHQTSASIRGNTDESWAHGVDYLIRHNLFPQEEAAQN